MADSLFSFELRAVEGVLGGFQGYQSVSQVINQPSSRTLPLPFSAADECTVAFSVVYFPLSLSLLCCAVPCAPRATHVLFLPHHATFASLAQTGAQTGGRPKGLAPANSQ